MIFSKYRNHFGDGQVTACSYNKHLINFYINKLIANPHLHDKVEFDVCITSYDFTFESKMHELVEAGFTKKEIEEIKLAFNDLTSSIVNESTIKIINIPKNEYNTTSSVTLLVRSSCCSSSK